MGVKGCGSFIKYSLFLFNAVIMVAGFGLMGFGIYTRTNSGGVTKFSSILGSNLLPTFALVLIVTGCAVVILSFLGCCGAIKEVRCMLMAYFLLLLVLFVCIVVGGILLYAFRHKIEDITLDQLRSQLKRSYGRVGEESVTEAWDSMQTLFKCCGILGGVNSTESWVYYRRNSDWFRNNTELAKISKLISMEYVPVSCCKDQQNTPNISQCQGVSKPYMIPATEPPVSDRQINDQLNTQGCYTSLQDILENNLGIFIGIAAGITLVIVLGMVFSLCLCKRINDFDYECD